MSDTTDFSIILILIGGFITYVYFIRKYIDAKNDINNIKCNPINLFLKSIYSEPSESIDEFAQCVQLLGPHDTILETTEPTPAAEVDTNTSKGAAKLFAKQDFGLPGFLPNS
jgi:hypothetical protein